MNENIHFDIELMNVSTNPLYFRRIDIYDSDPLIGQYAFAVKRIAEVA